jgi:CheY-like chemotaxis protein
LLDISDRKQLEAQLVQVGKLDALGQLTGGVAHDFNNLLAAVLGGVHLLERRLLLGEREQKVIDLMRHAAEQGTELVRRLMTFTRQQDLTPVSISSETLCESVAGLVNHSLGGTVVVDWQCANTKANLFADRNQIELALMNLIINARDAMPNGGTIKVSIDECPDSEIGRPALRIRVADEGNGIPQDIVDKVTEPFFTTKETGKGTGLGLSMVAGFVHQSGGKLEISSAPGKGTAIDLILPSTEAVPHAEKRIEGLGATWFSNKRLLLIDDDDAVRMVMSEQFRDAGGIVDDFACGRGAIDAVKKAPTTYDFVLSDFAMPGINGLETLKQIAKLAPTARLALMTGFAEEALLCKDQKIPVVRKPVDMRKVATIFAS